MLEHNGIRIVTLTINPSIQLNKNVGINSSFISMCVNVIIILFINLLITIKIKLKFKRQDYSIFLIFIANKHHVAISITTAATW